ncbi:MAG: AAA family ATPase [Gammaproteobacteria bacterium]|nr:AAA family ATPase [Gammaproteobacteria bacterium]
MYLKHFNFEEQPFGLTPNTQYFCNLPIYQEALNVLLVSLRSGEGFVKIIGETGTGKTMLCRHLINNLSADFVTAYLPNPQLSPLELHKHLVKELGISYKEDSDQYLLTEVLTQKLLDLYEHGKQVIVVVDEAQAMSDESLEALRLLSNLETEESKLLQIVLFGQPELNERLAQSNLRQLNQRIAFSYQLRPLTRQELEVYLYHRLAVTGYTKEDLFSPKAIQLIYRASGGIPRLSNILAHKALMAAYGQNQKQVDIKAVRTAILDTESTIKRGWFIYIINIAVIILLAALVTELYFVLM